MQTLKLLACIKVHKFCVFIRLGELFQMVAYQSCGFNFVSVTVLFQPNVLLFRKLGKIIRAKLIYLRAQLGKIRTHKEYFDNRGWHRIQIKGRYCKIKGLLFCLYATFIIKPGMGADQI